MVMWLQYTYLIYMTIGAAAGWREVYAIRPSFQLKYHTSWYKLRFPLLYLEEQVTSATSHTREPHIWQDFFFFFIGIRGIKGSSTQVHPGKGVNRIFSGAKRQLQLQASGSEGMNVGDNPWLWAPVARWHHSHGAQLGRTMCLLKTMAMSVSSIYYLMWPLHGRDWIPEPWWG